MSIKDKDGLDLSHIEWARSPVYGPSEHNPPRKGDFFPPINQKIPMSENNSYTLVDDMNNCSKINDHVVQIVISDLEDEIKKFKLIKNKLKYGNELTQEDREFFKLFLETLNHLYSNMGCMINSVYEMSEGKHN